MDPVQYHLGMSFDYDNMRLDGDTSEHPASRRSCQGNIPKTRVDVLDHHGTGDTSCLGAQPTAGGNDNQRLVQQRKRCVLLPLPMNGLVT